jgi:outer membrane protein assembly factor BamB
MVVCVACFHAFSSLAATAYTQVDWPQFLGPTRNGISPETGWQAVWPKEGPKILWEIEVGTGFSSVAVEGDRAYTMGNMAGQETLYCLKTETGEVVWKQGYPSQLKAVIHEGGPCCTPSVDKDCIYTLGKEGQMYCFEKTTGKVLWWRNLPKDYNLEVEDFGISCSPLLEGEQVIVDPGSMMALNKRTGSLIWKHEPVPRAFTSPVAFELEGRRLGATLNGYGLLVFEIDGGKEICKHPWETFDKTNCTTPVISGNRIFVSSAYDRGGAVLEVGLDKPPKVIWDNANMRNHFNISVLWEGHLYGFDGNSNRDNQGELRCLDFNTGEVRWSEPSILKGGLLISDGKLVAISDKGELAIAEASPKGFQALSRAQVLGGRCWTPPTLSGGRIYCRNAAGNVVCIDVRGQ